MAAALQSVASLKLTTSTSSLSSKTLAPPSSSSLSSASTTFFNPLRLKIIGRATKLSATSAGSSFGALMYDTVAGRYAAALADVANSNGTLSVTSDDVSKIESIFTDKEVYSFFTSPVIRVIEKRSVLDEIIKSAALQPHTANFLNVLVDTDRIELVKDIVKDFERVYNSITGTEMATVTSVVNLENGHLAQIAKGVQKLTGAKNVRIKTDIDPSLVAGFTIRYGDGGSKLVDFSVQSQLEEIADQIDIGDVQLI